MQNFIQTKNFENLTKSFVMVQPQSKKIDYKSLKKGNIKKLFSKYDIIIFRNFGFREDNIFQFVNKFTSKFAPDAPRRLSKFKNNKIKSVDIGNNEIDLHSEGSFTPVWPDLIWFYCKTPSKKSGFTTFCDGYELWESLSQQTKEFFLFNEVVYNVEIPFKKIPNKEKIQRWPLSTLGNGNSFVDWSKGKVKYTQKRYAVNFNKEDKKFYFVNHLLLNLKYEDQIKSIKVGNKKIPLSILKEIKHKSNKSKFEIKWNKNDFAMINNKRFLHGRTKINSKEKRDISIIQTLERNF